MSCDIDTEQKSAAMSQSTLAAIGQKPLSQSAARDLNLLEEATKNCAYKIGIAKDGHLSLFMSCVYECDLRHFATTFQCSEGERERLFLRPGLPGATSSAALATPSAKSSMT